MVKGIIFVVNDGNVLGHWVCFGNDIGICHLCNERFSCFTNDVIKIQAPNDYQQYTSTRAYEREGLYLANRLFNTRIRYSWQGDFSLSASSSEYIGTVKDGEIILVGAYSMVVKNDVRYSAIKNISFKEEITIYEGR